MLKVSVCNLTSPSSALGLKLQWEEHEKISFDMLTLFYSNLTETSLKSAVWNDEVSCRR